MEIFLLILLVLAVFGAILWALCGYLGRKLAIGRGRSGAAGLIIGLLFGVIGLAIVWVFLSETAEHQARAWQRTEGN